MSNNATPTIIFAHRPFAAVCAECSRVRVIEVLGALEVRADLSTQQANEMMSHDFYKTLEKEGWYFDHFSDPVHGDDLSFRCPDCQ